jgi:hypothetical protein
MKTKKTKTKTKTQKKTNGGRGPGRPRGAQNMDAKIAFRLDRPSMLQLESMRSPALRGLSVSQLARGILMQAMEPSPATAPTSCRCSPPETTVTSDEMSSTVERIWEGIDAHPIAELSGVPIADPKAPAMSKSDEAPEPEINIFHDEATE